MTLVILTASFAVMIRRAVMRSVVVSSFQTPQIAFGALERAQLNRCLDVGRHLVEVALKKAHARVLMSEAGRVDDNPGLDSGNSMLHQTIEILTESFHPLVLAGFRALGILRPRRLQRVQNVIWVVGRVLAVVMGVKVIMRLAT
jgi:hypothetical protein